MTSEKQQQGKILESKDIVDWYAASNDVLSVKPPPVTMSSSPYNNMLPQKVPMANVSAGTGSNAANGRHDFP